MCQRSAPRSPQAHHLQSALVSCLHVNDTIRLTSNLVEGGVFDTPTSITKTSDRPVIRPAGKLLLHRL